MTEYAARLVMDRLHMRPSHMAPQYADPLGAVALLPGSLLPASGSSLSADLRDFARADKAVQAEAYQTRLVEMASQYGYGPSSAPAVVEKPYVFQDGTAIIPVHGMLINRFSYSWGFVTGYQFIRNMLNAALGDDDVERVVFDVNSFGGAAAGLPEIAQEIYDSRLIKPSIAVIDPFCYSAAYFLASAATKVICTPSGGVGSIGTLLMHTSYQDALEEAGVKITYIFAGDHKVDGNAYQDLTADVKADLQSLVDDCNSGFVAAVARNRNINAPDVTATQAKCFNAIDAQRINLIDAVEVSSAAIGWFLQAQAGDSSDDDCDDDNDDIEDGIEMSTPAVVPAAVPAVIPAAALPAATATQAGMTPADVAAAVQSALREDRQRRRDIIGCEEAKGRTSQAAYLADNTEMTVEAAKAMLSASAKEPAPAAPANGNGRSPFAATMDASRNPGVGPDAAQQGGQQGSGEPDAAAKGRRVDAAKDGAFGPPKKAARG